MNLELMPRTRTRDVSGFDVFSHGDAGQAHVMAHRMLDGGRHELGHGVLGAWLDGHDGGGSDWTHLQWHMAIFEIAVGAWEEALTRFETHILPAATDTHDALTDAPAMLWRLELAAPRPVSLAWEPVHATAVHQLTRPSTPYVELHCLLALAGARDLDGLDRWLHGRRSTNDRKATLLAQMGIGLRAFAAGDYELASVVLAAAVPRVSELGGSHAQNLLFQDIADLSWTRAQTMTRAAA
ncbi:MAG: hypothetical protein JRE45_15975 [Deltaproteobacteria bacterium]|nr:hypothetical protein [Deltaproteobacteria bacterium]